MWGAFGGLGSAWEALRMVNYGPEWSRMVTWRLLGRLGGSLEVLRGCMGFLGTVMRALVGVSMVQNGLLERLGGSLEVLREGLWRSSEGAWGLLGRS